MACSHPRRHYRVPGVAYGAILGGNLPLAVENGQKKTRVLLCPRTHLAVHCYSLLVLAGLSMLVPAFELCVHWYHYQATETMGWLLYRHEGSAEKSDLGTPAMAADYYASSHCPPFQVLAQCFCTSLRHSTVSFAIFEAISRAERWLIWSDCSTPIQA